MGAGAGCRPNLIDRRFCTFANVLIGVVLGKSLQFRKRIDRFGAQFAELRCGQTANATVGLLQGFYLGLWIEPGGL